MVKVEKAEKKCPITPFHDLLVVKVQSPVKQSKGGIHIPDAATGKADRGVVLAVGPGKMLDNGIVFPCSAKVGQTVIFGKYAGIDVPVDGEEYRLVHECEISGILEQ